MKHPTGKTSLNILMLLIAVAAVFTTTTLFADTNATDQAITSPPVSGAKISELNEYATMVQANPWDMNDSSDLKFYRELESGIANSTFTAGYYQGQMQKETGGARITLLSYGARNNAAMRVGVNGYNYPINADYYRYLTVRLYKGCTSCDYLSVHWELDDSGTNTGVTRGQALGGAGWKTIVIDLETVSLDPSFQTPWNGLIRELRIHPYGGSGTLGSTVRLDWARLTHEDPRTARPYTVTWENGSGTYNIYASAGDRNLDGRDVLLKSGVSGASGQAEVQTGILPAGTYYIALQATNGGVVWSPGPLIINDVPQIEITSPSMTSGADYAETVLGDAWDMNNIDLNTEGKPWQRTCVQNESYSAGVYAAQLYQCPSTNQYIDPILYLGHMDVYPSGAQQDPPIDTNKFRYLTFRYYLSGEQNVAQGWVSRFGWWQTSVGDNITTQEVVISRDIILEEGWNTYKIDLWANDVVDEAYPIQRSWRDSAPNRMRFDPAELSVALLPASMQLDWIKLTAVEEINRGDTYQVAYNLDSNDSTNVTFYVDTDKNPAGRMTLQVTSGSGGSQPSAGEYLIYLPLVNNGSCGGAECLTWDTSSVARGEYYICAEVDDGYNTIYRCSETTITVR